MNDSEGCGLAHEVSMIGHKHRSSMPYRIRHTATYYEDHAAAAFFADTATVDLAPLYARFLAQLRADSHILDAGCGSGRDARAFLAREYTVTAFDASPTLAALASWYGGLPVQVKRFQEIDWHGEFDGIWACASLLHVPLVELPEVLERLALALKPGGTLYASFKYGCGEREHGGRRFTDLDESGLAALLGKTRAFSERDTWRGHRRIRKKSYAQA